MTHVCIIRCKTWRRENIGRQCMVRQRPMQLICTQSSAFD